MIAYRNRRGNLWNPTIYTKITTDSFEDVHGESINDIIQCAAPKSLAKAWLSGGSNCSSFGGRLMLPGE